MEPVFTFHYSDIVGYLASAMVLISFMMKDMRMLRIINTIGCILFIVYAFLIDISIPVIITNAAIAGINIYYILKPKKAE